MLTKFDTAQTFFNLAAGNIVSNETGVVLFYTFATDGGVIG